MKTCQKPTKRCRESREGTEVGYRRHRRAGEEPCAECREAAKLASRKRYVRGRAKLKAERAKELRPWNPETDLVCEKPTPAKPGGARGTTQGFNRHRQAGERPCEECSEAQKACQRERYHRTKERYREQRNLREAKRKEAKRDEIRKKDREYYQTHKEASRAHKRARDRKISCTYDGYSLEMIAEEHGSTCPLCGEEVDLSIERGWSDSPHVDHVIPVCDEQFPGDVLDNVRLTHARCNMKKGSRRIEEMSLPLEPPEHERYKE